MNQRDYLKNDTVIELYSDEGDGRNKRQFHITRLISNEGGSTIAYRAYHENSSNIGVLREFYPTGDGVDIGLYRNPEDKLCVDMSEDSEAERVEFFENRERYLAPFLTLKNIQREKENDTLATFIPYFEICYGCPDRECDDGTIYIWTPAPQTETFDVVCQRIHENPTKDPEYNLYLILEAVYSLAQCTYELHNTGLIHRDIKPGNFGFALRSGEVLTQTISLFDVDSICEAYPKPKDVMGTRGFMPDNKEMLNTGRQDIYAIGATLFYAVIHTDETKNNGFAYAAAYYDKISDLVRESVIIKASQNNSYPRIRKVLSQILKKCLMEKKTDARGISLAGESRYNGCGELIEDLKTLLGYVIPAEISQRLTTGEKWLLSDAKKWFKSTDEQKSKQAIQYHLYKWPLYRNISKDETLKIMILGMGRYGYQFLDIALQLSQNLDMPVEFTVISNSLIQDDETDRDIYLSERPEIASFFSVDGEDVKDSYGSIRFASHSLDENGLNGLIEDFESNGRSFSYVFIDLNNDKANKEAAEKVHRLGDSMTIAYTNENVVDDENRLENIIPINVNEDIRHLEGFADIERMSYNAHLVWNNNPDIDFDTKMLEFKQDYNYESCISNTLSIKYKLWNEDIDLMSMSMEDAAEKFFGRVNGNNKMVRRLAWLEHKRWVTEKLCNGWRGRKVKECAGLTQDKKGKSHVCIIRSSDEWGLKDIKESRWNDGGIDTQTLDDLDRVSVELHRFYVHQADNLKIGEFSEIYKMLNGSLAASYFREWHESLKSALRDGSREAAEYCKGCRTKLQAALQRTDMTRTLKKQVLEVASNAMEPLVRKYEYTDYKKYDVELIEKIPYILTHSSSCALVVPMEPAESDEIIRTMNPRNKTMEVQVTIDRVFSYVAAATVVNPEKIIFIYKPDEDNFENGVERARMFDSLVNRIIRYMTRKNLRAELYFSLFCEESETYNEFLSYKKELHEVTGRAYSYEVFLISDSEHTYKEVDEYVETVVTGCNLVAVEKTNIVTNGWLIDSEMIAKYASYTFDTETMMFGDNKSCRWLSYVGLNSALRVLDMASLVNRRYDIDMRLDFSDEQSEYLWNLYKHDSMKWKYLGKLLGAGRMQKAEIVRIGRNNAQSGDKTKREYYFPMSCMDGVEVIVNQMKRDGILDEQSVITSVTEDMCLLTVCCNDKLAFAIGKILSQPERLTDADCIIIDKTNKTHFVVEFSLLTVSDSEQGSMDDIRNDIDKQVRGFIQDDDERKKKVIAEVLRDDEASLRELRNKGYLHYLRTSDTGIGFTYGSYAIKNILVDEGKILEMRVYKELDHLGFTNSTINGIKFYHEDGFTEEDELDCIATRGFRGIIIECKAKEKISYTDVKSSAEKLSSRVKRFAVNGTGLLLIDSSNPLPDYKAPEGITIKRVDDIPGNKRYKIGLYINSIMN